MAMINRGQNHITISWKNDDTVRGRCVLELLDELKQWRAVYRGEKDEIKVTGLTPCTCYDFRLRIEDETEWQHFKGATTDEGFWSMHITRAVSVSKLPLIRKIVHSKPWLLEVENKNMKTPLFQAVEKNDLQVVSLLVTLGANVNTVSFYAKRSALMTALARGYLGVASFLVDKGCSVESTDVNGLNALHHAVDSNNVDSVRFALKYVKNVDCQDNKGWTPLLRAVILCCSEDIVELLLENGASKTLKDRNGFDYEKHKVLAKNL